MWTIRDFQPVNHWTFDKETHIYRKCHTAANQHSHIVDQSTQERYLKEPENMIRFKCVILFFTTPWHGIEQAAGRITQLITLSHFWKSNPQRNAYMFQARLLDAGNDLLRVIAQSLAIIGLQLAAVYGVARPYDGRKLYASIERAAYGSAFLAPSFQPHEIGILSIGILSNDERLTRDDELLARELQAALNSQY